MADTGILPFILPAPEATRQEAGILWYEASESQDGRRCVIEAFASADGKK
jgi:quinol monooxygenase YgiN